MQSLLAIAGHPDLNELEGLDGQDLSGLLLGRDQKGRDYVIQQGIELHAIRRGDWKFIPEGRNRNRGKIGQLIFEPIDSPGKLVFLPEDAKEETNLASRYPDIAASMASLLQGELSSARSRFSLQDDEDSTNSPEGR